MRTIVAAVGVACVSAMFFAGCDSIGLSPGEYTTLRIAAGSTTKAGTCAPMNPNDVTTSNVRTGGTWLIWGATSSSGDTFFVDDGKTVLQGAQQSDGSYQFIGKTTDVAMQGNNTTVTTVDTTTISFTISGDNVSGTTTDVATTACSGQCMGFNAQNCSTTDSFVGVSVTGADVPH
jgi:hypothetical protein